jgi:hypothetical protein
MDTFKHPDSTAAALGALIHVALRDHAREFVEVRDL